MFRIVSGVDPLDTEPLAREPTRQKSWRPGGLGGSAPVLNALA
jgi:hypothetical protein